MLADVGESEQLLVPPAAGLTAMGSSLTAAVSGQRHRRRVVITVTSQNGDGRLTG